MKVEHPCPQCGGPVILEETDRFLNCGFCRVRLYIVSNGFLRYYLPPLTKKAEDMVFVPYWRFRGMAFSMRGVAIQHKMIDTSVLSSACALLSPSLGFRTQALKMKFATPKIKAAYLPKASSFKEVLQKIESSNQFFGAAPDPVFHRAFIGETMSLVYAPTYIHNNKVFDAILNSSIGVLNPASEAIFSQCDLDENWGAHFVSALCPDCGWDLSGERSSIILFCIHCHSAWHAEAEIFKKVDLLISKSDEDDIVYLPFWKVSADVNGLALNTYAEFSKIVTPPKAVNAKGFEKPFSFWSPAFRANPKIYLRLSSQMTVAQPPVNHQETIPKKMICPVTVDAQEAFESVKITLANTVASKQAFFQKLPDIQIIPKSSVLVLIPFHLRGSELIHPQIAFSIQKRSIRGLKC